MTAFHTCAVLLVLLTVNTPALSAAPTVPEGVRVYEPGPAPRFQLSDMDGQQFDLEKARGKWLFVHFWASWCGPCRKEMPAIQRLQDLLRNESTEIVLVNTAEDEDTIFGFMAELAPAMTSYMDTDGSITEQWQPRGLPATYLVDPQGMIRYQALGGRPWDQPLYLDFLRKLEK